MTRCRKHGRAVAGLFAVALVAASCSSGGDGGSGSDEAASQSDRRAEPAAACEQGATVDQVDAEPVEGVESDVAITSFDGTVIRAHWFPAPEATADDPVPTVLMGPGWSMPGDTNVEGSPILSSAMTIGNLHEAGYNVLTWDPRGFGESTGAATVNDPENEGRDVQVLLDWVASQPEARSDDDGNGDPRVGMVGASYGGGIQLTVAGIDCRVDALVPNIAWHSLETSLFPHETVKAGWSGLLSRAAAGAQLDPHITGSSQAAIETGIVDEELVDWYRSRGPGDAVGQVSAPTLLVHGTVDTLFTTAEAIANFQALQEAGTTVAMTWYCGGHGTCLTDPGDPALVRDRTLAWLSRYLKDDEQAEVGPVVDVTDQNGARWTGEDYPTDPDGELGAGSTGGTLPLTAGSVAGPLTEIGTDPMAGVVAGITPARAERAVELVLEADRETLVLGPPHLRLTYSGSSPDGPEPTRAFAQLVDDETGHVVGNQITPVPLTLDGEEHTAEVDLEVVAHHLTGGQTLTLQIVATTPAYATPRLGGELTVSEIELSLPTTDALTRSRS